MVSRVEPQSEARARPSSVGAGSIAVASLALMVTGIVRQKLMVVTYGPDTLGAVAQANLFQSVLGTIFGAGIVLGARVLLSDGSLAFEERVRVGSWLVKRPLLVGCALTPVAWLAGPWVSKAFTGSTEWAFAFQMAAVGSVLAMTSSSAIATTQILGTRTEYLRSAAMTAIASVAVTSLLVISGNQSIAFSSLAVAPLVGVVVFAISSPAFRLLVHTRARIDRRKLKRAGGIGAGSFVNASVALAVSAWLSARLAHEASLAEVALLQPALMVSAAAMLVTGSLTSALMYRYNLSASGDDVVRRSGPWRDALSAGGLLLLAGVVLLPIAPVLISLLYDSSLLEGTPLVAVQVSAEVLTCIVWIAGSMLVPSGRLRLWVVSSVGGQVVKLTVGVLLLPVLGASAIPVAGLAQYVIGVLVLLVALRPNLGVRQAVLLGAVAAATMVLPLSWLGYPAFRPLPLAVAALLAVAGMAQAGVLRRGALPWLADVRSFLGGVVRRIRQRLPGHTLMSEEVALRNLVDICDALERRGVVHWLTDGTLLGLIREGGFIKHDGDTDVGVLARTFDPEAIADLVAVGFALDGWLGQIDDSFELTFVRDGVKTDLFFFYEIIGGGMRHAAFYKFDEDSAERVDYTYGPVEPIRRQLLGHEFWTPSDAEGYLQEKYGPDWRTPIVDWDYALSPANAAPTGIRIPFESTRSQMESRWGTAPSSCVAGGSPITRTGDE